MSESSPTPEIIVRAATNADGPRVRALVFGVLREFGLAPDPDGTDRDLFDLEAHYAGRGGLFELLEDREGNLLGTCGLYPLDAGTIELRKMYFALSLRGRGEGRRTLQRMIDAARARGCRRLYLETASVLARAVALYEKFGFRPTGEKHSPRCDQAFYLDLD